MDFNNYRIVPREVSQVSSRTIVNTSVEVTGLKLDVPVICPGMHSLVSQELINHVEFAGSAVVQPREVFLKSQKPIYNVSLDNLFVMAKGTDDNAILAVELNNGYLQKLFSEIRLVKSLYPKKVIWAGAVCSIQGCYALAEAGADAVIVGNGVGSVCETTPRTSVGLPPLDTLVECQNSPIPVILAGGIRKIGDVVLSLVFGADLVMVGSLLANCYDTAGQGKYWGEASAKQKGNFNYIEGKEITLPVGNFTSGERIVEIKQGIQSACSFVNAFNIKQLKEHAQVVRIE